MARNYTFNFARHPSTELPPRFPELLARLESIGIYGAILSHPDADWNQINLTIGRNRIRQEDLEKAFRDLGYKFIE